MLARGFKTRCENISLQLRREMGLKKTDPLSCDVFAGHLGVILLSPGDITGLSSQAKAVLLGDAKNSWSAVTISYDNTDIVIYNPSHSMYRRSSDVMHELSHIILQHEPSKIIVSPAVGFVMREYNEVLESEAAWLAGCLLLPREILLHVKMSRMSSRDAQRMYEVSNDLLMYRMNITGVSFQTLRLRR